MNDNTSKFILKVCMWNTGCTLCAVLLSKETKSMSTKSLKKCRVVVRNLNFKVRIILCILSYIKKLFHYRVLKKTCKQFFLLMGMF